MKILPLLLASAGVAFACSGVGTAADLTLSFRELEYQQPRDPLLPSNQSAGILQHTSETDIASAVVALRSLMPIGTTRTAAEAILARAGARCHRDDARLEHCSYSDVETRDEYVDAVRWNVLLNLTDDEVQALSVDRSWTRS